MVHPLSPSPGPKRKQTEPKEDEEVEKACPTKRPKGLAQGIEIIRAATPCAPAPVNPASPNLGQKRKRAQCSLENKDVEAPPPKRQRGPANIDLRLWGVEGPEGAGASVLVTAPALDNAPEAMREPSQVTHPKDHDEDPELAVKYPDPETQRIGYRHEWFDMEHCPIIYSMEPELAAEHPDPEAQGFEYGQQARRQYPCSEGQGFGYGLEEGQEEPIYQYPEPSAWIGSYYLDIARLQAITKPQIQDTAPALTVAEPQNLDRKVDFRTVRPVTRSDRREIELALKYTRRDFRDRLGERDLEIRSTKGETYLTQYREIQRKSRRCWTLQGVGKAPGLSSLDATSRTGSLRV